MALRRSISVVTCALFLALLPAIAAGADVPRPVGTTAERATELRGVVRLWHGDELPAPTQEGVVLDTGGRVYDLDLPLAQAARYAGATVRVTGLVRANLVTPTQPLQVLAAADGTGGATTTTAVAAAATVKKVVVILMNFSNKTTQAWTPDFVENVVLDGNLDNPNSVRAYYEESSEDAVTLQGAVFGWYTIAADDLTCEYRTWASQAIAAASADALAAGYDLTSTAVTKVYAFPSTASCTWSGLGELPGDESWIDGSMTLRTVGHELGHNFGVHHASTLSCTNATGARVSVTARRTDDCSASEYGDPFTIMGGAATRTHPAWHRAQLGFPMGSATITPSASMDQTYTLTALEPGTDAAAVRLLRITRPTSPVSYLDLELRAPRSPFDPFTLTDPAVVGVSARIGWANSNRAQSLLLDSTLGTTSFSDAPIPVGSAGIWDPVSGVRVSVVSISGGVATVRVLGEPDAAAPTPVTNLVATTDATPRVTLTWSAATDDRLLAGYEIRRNGVRCAIVKGLTVSDTGAWSGCAGLVGGQSYTYAVVAYDGAGKTATAVSTTITAASADVTAPSTPGTPALTSATATSVTFSWSASTDNVGVTGYEILRDGTSLGTTASTSYTASGLSPTTSSTYTVRARDAAANWSAISAGAVLSTLAAPQAPASVTASASSRVITISWTAGTGALSYEIVREVYDSRRARWTVQTTLTTANTSITDTVAKGTYRYRVRAVSGGATSAYTTSNSVSVTR